MFSNDYNLNQIRVFDAVYRHQSMTRAAKELHLTQSGISQHIASLESALSTKLFDRVQKRLVPTPVGKKLYEQCHPTLNSLERSLREIKGAPESLTGEVSIGLPSEFGNYFAAPILARFAQRHPGVSLNIKTDIATTMQQQLMDNEVDFALLDSIHFDSRIDVEPIWNETLELCVHLDLLPASPELVRTLPAETIDQIPWIDYDESGSLLALWFNHHFPKRRVHPTIRIVMKEARGVAQMILNGAGAGVLSDYLFNRLIADNHKVVRFPGSGVPVINQINVARRRGRTLSPAALSALAFLKEELARLRLRRRQPQKTPSLLRSEHLST